MSPDVNVNANVNDSGRASWSCRREPGTGPSVAIADKGYTSSTTWRTTGQTLRKYHRYGTVNKQPDVGRDPLPGAISVQVCVCVCVYVYVYEESS